MQQRRAGGTILKQTINGALGSLTANTRLNTKTPPKNKISDGGHKEPTEIANVPIGDCKRVKKAQALNSSRPLPNWACYTLDLVYLTVG